MILFVRQVKTFIVEQMILYITMLNFICVISKDFYG